ncbi:hypothetical protein T02_568 [Trichinella nativa]|uniref:Uncharacterized protein n=1 Tax=Trichinella nativa TaxID=6335 RepID=A0A0V1KKH3_9BILA|nr:hypothetical protein T02_3293 [Trichinella nativa]KRZ48044.1 hypothetical protein T02_568 [Trichinella nativa]
MRTLLVTLIDQKCTVRTFETKDNLRKQRRLILVKIAPSAPSVCLSTVSRPVELSLQSSFQLSLAVLVRYRSHLPPALGCSLKQPDSIRSRDTMHKTSFVMGPAPALKPQSREPTN